MFDLNAIVGVIVTCGIGYGYKESIDLVVKSISAIDEK